MKVVSAEIFGLNLDLSPQYRRMTPAGWRPIIIKLMTDEGVVGIGEAGLAYGVANSGGIGTVRDFIQAFAIGIDPFDRETVWNDMQRRSFWGGACGPIVNAAMSAIDIALWDIVGKALNQPIWRLLGGKVQPELRCYASQTQFSWGTEHMLLSHPEEYGEAAARAIAEGYDAIKVDPVMLTENNSAENHHRLKGVLDQAILKRATTRMAAIRDAVPNADIILELHSLTSVSGAQQLAEACAEFDLYLIEEPVNYNSDRNAKTLKSRLPSMRTAAGERIFTRWQYRGYLEDGSLDVVQPDFCLAGGITEGKKICDMAHAYEVTVQGHVCGSPISTAVAMHIETAIPNFQIHEYHMNATRPDNRNICLQDPQPVKGKFTISDAPGLGLDLNEDFVRKHAKTIETVK